MLTVYDRNRKKVAVLQNAYGIKEDLKINAVWSLSFTLPLDDDKNQYCQPFSYIECEERLYRIQPTQVEDAETGSVVYTCEHVIATLMDNVLYGYHVVGNLGYPTRRSIEYVLNHQLTKNWTLWQCDFSRQFEYGWEQENLLGALFSIPQPFTENYQWDYDTTVYPWRLKLLRMDENTVPQLYIRKGKNMLNVSKQSDPQNICTRLYPLGYGEGVNQLTIESVNEGITYLQSPQKYIDRYGIVERIWVDRRYENAESLKEAAQSMLDELQEPTVEYSVTFAQLSGDVGQVGLGRKVRISDPEAGVEFDTFITGLTLNHDDIASSQLTIANRPKDIASTVADLADRQRIEMTYSQGATQLYAQSLQGNADEKNGTVIDFYIPQEMRIVNKVVAKVRMSQFRAYSKATEDGGGATQTSSSGGGTADSTSSGGGSASSTASGGGTTNSSTNGATVSVSVSNVNYSSAPASGTVGYTSDQINHGTPAVPDRTLGVYEDNITYHTHNLRDHYHTFNLPEHQHNIAHGHTASVGSHSHSFSVPSHSHSFSVPSHSHSFTVPSHSHSVDIPAHGHEITPGIYFFGGADSFSLYVNGKLKRSYSSSSVEIDLTDDLTGDNGMIPRNGWQSIEIRPNGLAYVVINIMVQGFVQSRGDKTV